MEGERDVVRAAGQDIPPGGAPPNLEDHEGDPRVQQLRTDVESWLRTYTSPRTRESYAERLGAPRNWIPDRTNPDPQRRRGRRPRGYSGAEWLLWCWLHSIPYLEPATGDVNRWLDELDERGYSQRTQAAWVYSTSSFYRHLISENRTRSNPMDQVNQRTRALRPSNTTRVRKPLTLEQLRTLLEATWLLAPHTRNGPRDRAMMELLAGTGMRADELVGLDLASYDRPSAGSTATVLLPRKAGAPRRLDVPAEAADAVDDYLALRRPGAPADTGDLADQPLFVSSTGARLHTKHVTYVLRQIVEAFTSDSPPRQRWKRNLLASPAGTRISSVLREIKGATGPHRVRDTVQTHAIQAEQSAGHQLSTALHHGWAKLTYHGQGDEDPTRNSDSPP